MENNNMDLRSVIGWFFMIISVLLLITSFVEENGHEINRITGVVFLIFGVVMYGLARMTKNKTKAKKQAESSTTTT